MARQKAFDEAALLERAMELFWEQGYEATSVRDLNERLHLSSSSLYNTFGGKHDLYLAALASYRRVEYAQVQAQLAEAPAAKDAVARLFNDLAASLLADESRRGSFTLNAAVELGNRDETVAYLLQQHFADVTELLAAFLTEAQARGELGSAHAPRDLASFLLHNLYSLAALVKVNASRAEMERIIHVTLSVLS
ncbi:MAG: TetR family transcriptional regulator [Anaerolineae bacterium]|nr:TetR family transcriptional regulator [Anaerolineae bacterium]